MMMSLLADKLVIVKIKIIVNNMNEIINPPCNSLLATFFETESKVCLRRASSYLRRFVRPKRTISQLFELLFPLPLLMSPKRKLLETKAKRLLWEVQREEMQYAVCRRQADTEADVEDDDQDFYVAGGVDDVGVSRYESEGFTLSEILSRKGLAKKNVSEGVIDSAHLPQCEFSNLHHLPLA